MRIVIDHRDQLIQLVGGLMIGKELGQLLLRWLLILVLREELLVQLGV